jgi:hypothetical protein
VEPAAAVATIGLVPESEVPIVMVDVGDADRVTVTG